MTDSRCNFNFFQDIYMTNGLYPHFHDFCDHQNRTAGTSKGEDSVETNQAGTGDVIQSRSRKLKRTL